MGIDKQEVNQEKEDEKQNNFYDLGLYGESDDDEALKTRLSLLMESPKSGNEELQRRSSGRSSTSEYSNSSEQFDDMFVDHTLSSIGLPATVPTVPATVAATVPVTAADPNLRPLDRFTQLQTAGGFWRLDDNIANIVGKTLSLLQSSQPTGCTQDAWATAIAICFLEKSFAVMKDEWSMIADKARKWLKKEVKGELDNILAAAIKLLT